MNFFTTSKELLHLITTKFIFLFILTLYEYQQKCATTQK